MSEAFVRLFVPSDGANEVPLVVIGLAALLDGVTDGVTFKGKAADDGGGMPTAGSQSLCAGATLTDKPATSLRDKVILSGYKP